MRISPKSRGEKIDGAGVARVAYTNKGDPPVDASLRLRDGECRRLDGGAAARSRRGIVAPPRYPLSMNEKPQPPPPTDDDEARFDDEGSAIGHPEPDETERPKQKTKAGAETPRPEAR
jgi:hypothetical protein